VIERPADVATSPLGRLDEQQLQERDGDGEVGVTGRTLAGSAATSLDVEVDGRSP
jgi:hypothetical protein